MKELQSQRSFPFERKRSADAGILMVEMLLSIAFLTFSLAGLYGSYITSITLGDHAMNTSLAYHDATQVLEQARQLNEGNNCSVPNIDMDGGWDAWLAAQGKSVRIPDAESEQIVVVTCQNRDGTQYCGTNQVDGSEWQTGAGATNFNPLRVTVSVCWRHNGRVYGECVWDGSSLNVADMDGDSVITSPATLSTLIACDA